MSLLRNLFIDRTDEAFFNNNESLRTGGDRSVSVDKNTRRISLNNSKLEGANLDLSNETASG